MYYNFYNIRKIKTHICNNEKVYLYPEGKNTKDLIKFLKFANIKIAGVIDRNPQRYQDIEAYRVEDVVNNSQSAVFITSPKYETELVNELREKKYKGSIEIFYNKEKNLYKTSNYLIMKRMDLVLTTKCTLRCKRCANLMQYYEHPMHVNLDVVINSMEKLLSAIDEIQTVYVLGGEPFLYPQLEDVMLYLKRQEKIKNINIVTNGTICPSYEKNFWDNISGKNVTIYISNYGELSRKKQQLFDMCCKYLVNCEISENNVFYDTGNMIKRNRSIEELQKVFERCNTQCRSLYNGELHFCPRSSHGVDLKIIDRREEDYINVLNIDDKERLRVEIENFINRKNYIEACDFCDIRCPGYYENEYPVAEQISEIIRV